MGVDGISKADIFDEYFDDDKPKITNYQKIKSMNIDDLAIFLSMFAYTCGETEYNQEDYLLWLQQEVRE